MTKATVLHNSVAPRITAEFISAMVAGGAKDADIMVALESIVLGVLIANESIFRVPRTVTAEALEMLAIGVAERLIEHKPIQDEKDYEHG